MPPLRVLLVDDNARFLEAAARFLSRESLSIVGQARSGAQALEQVAQLQPDLVLIDVAMPGMSGLDATRLIKGQPNPPRVVILTFHDNAEYRAVAQSAGADGFVAKTDFGVQLLPLIETMFAKPERSPLVE